MVVWFQETHLMADKSGQPDKQQPLELISDFPGEDRHQFVAKLAYKPSEERGRPPVRLRQTAYEQNKLCTRFC